MIIFPNSEIGILYSETQPNSRMRSSNATREPISFVFRFSPFNQRRCSAIAVELGREHDWSSSSRRDVGQYVGNCRETEEKSMRVKVSSSRPSMIELRGRMPMNA